MKSQLSIRTKDLRRLAAAVDRAHLGTPGVGLPTSVLQAVLELVPCDEVGYLAINPSRQEFIADDGLNDDIMDLALETDPVRMDELYWRNFHNSLSCSFQYWTGDHATAHKATDFYDSERAYFNSELGELMRLGGGRFTTLVPLHPDGDIEHMMLLFRVSGRDFSEREQLLLNLLRPHLADLELETRRMRRSAGLTARQAELVELVAQGLTNRQIATRLKLSEATVRTHMENIFERLGVTSRSAAVARIAGARLMPLVPEPADR